MLEPVPQLHARSRQYLMGQLLGRPNGRRRIFTSHRSARFATSSSRTDTVPRAFITQSIAARATGLAPARAHIWDSRKDILEHRLHERPLLPDLHNFLQSTHLSALLDFGKEPERRQCSLHLRTSCFVHTSDR